MVSFLRKIQSAIDRFKAKHHWNHQKGQPVKVGFLVHNIATVDCFIPIIRNLEADERFEIFVASINKKFPGDKNYAGEEIVHRELDRLGIGHIRLNMLDSMEGNRILRRARLDVIFRQSPWEVDIEEGYRIPNLDFALQCYTPYYGVHFNHADDEHLRYHRRCWKIFVDNDTAEKYYRKGVFTSEKVAATGLTKYEYLHDELRRPVRKRFAKCVIWAPHHAVSEGWLNFATFHHIYRYMLDYVTQHPGFHFIFRPHSAFYNNYIETGTLSKEEMDAFYAVWNALPNTSISVDEDYIELFRQSDAMVTDGVSFLTAYQMTEKPLIWTRSPGHTPLNALGEEMVECLYPVNVDEMEKVGSLLTALLMNLETDVRKEKRQGFARRYLYQPDARPSENIKKIILKEFGF